MVELEATGMLRYGEVCLKQKLSHFRMLIFVLGWKYLFQDGSIYFRMEVFILGWKYLFQDGSIYSNDVKPVADAFCGRRPGPQGNANLQVLVLFRFESIQGN